MDTVSLRLLSKIFRRLFTGFSEMVGIGVSEIENHNLSTTLPFFKTKDLDFAGLTHSVVTVKSFM